MISLKFVWFASASALLPHG